MMYVLDHYYDANHTESCLVINSEKTGTELAEICAAISFLFSTLTPHDTRLNKDYLLNVLVTYYGATNAKPQIAPSLLSRIVPPKHRMFDELWRVHKGCFYLLDIRGTEPDGLPDFMIDLDTSQKEFSANRHDVMNKWLPKEESLQELVELLKQAAVVKN